MNAELIREVRERNDIVEVVSSYVSLKRAGKNYVALCPFHQEKTPSFTVSPDKQLWHCFGCGLGGDVFSFVQRVENIPFGEALRKLAERVGIKIERLSGGEASLRARLIEINKLAMNFYELALWSNVGKAARDYLKRRGISEEIARCFNLGYAPAEWEALTNYLKKCSVAPEEAVRVGLIIRAETGDRYYDRFRDRLMFPIMSASGDVIGFGGRALGDNPAKYINTPETPIFQKRDVLYALHIARKAIQQSGAAIVVEGYMDAIALHQFGFQNTVATMGTALTPQMLSQLRRYAGIVYLAFDADSAGMSATLRSSALFRQMDVEVRVVAMPEGMDPDGYVRREGAEAFKALVEKSFKMIDYKVERFLLSSEGSRPTSQALRHLMAILREVDDPLERERVMQRVARCWSEGDGERVIRTLEAIQSAWRKHEAASSTRAISTSADNAIERALLERSKAPLPKGVEQAERELVAAMLQDELAARRIIELLSPDEFILQSHSQIARIVVACIEGDEFHNLPQYISELTDEQLRSQACGLMMADLSFINAEGAIESRVETIKRYKIKQQSRQMRERLLKMAESGSIDSSSPEVAQLLKLEKQLRGKC
ncbi:MAG: DNA primase [Armatimonadota bacterium]|nr:DNA primase [Armatimonadota bacterium]MCX7777353.1 DNA primase [Armatimonadota bacterium]MDW8025379.1 DNA primase [Armatimonadota bacterium]